MMELKKVQCKFLQTIVMQRRRHSERQKELPVVIQNMPVSAEKETLYETMRATWD